MCIRDVKLNIVKVHLTCHINICKRKNRINMKEQLKYDKVMNSYSYPPHASWQLPAELAQTRKEIEVDYVPIHNEQIILLHNVLSAEECKHILKESEKMGYQLCDHAHRSNCRVIVTDFQLAKTLTDRIEPFIPTQIERHGRDWSFYSLNECFRFCRYTSGQLFVPHGDRYFKRGANDKSWYTFMIYLNNEDEFEGGHTRFLQDMNHLDQALYSVEPKAGTALVFPHQLLHEGQLVTSGTKYIMRSELMYKGNLKQV
jgi:prolyl 4-hydroxylase